MIRFICKSVYCLPDGSKDGVSYKTFTEQDDLEKWLRAVNNYETRTLVGCELPENEE